MSTTTPKPKTARPETLRQARTWESTKNQYRALGLCWACACQAAEGHAIGFTAVHSPCALCAPIVAKFPQEKANNWRAYPEKARRAAARVAVSAGTDQSRSDDAPAPQTVTHGKCGRSWTQHGDLTSHCPSCHETFAGLVGFDRHRVDGSCLAPADAVTSGGTALFELSAEGAWSLTKTESQRTWLAARTDGAARVVA